MTVTTGVKVKYNSVIDYRARKIKPEADLKASVDTSSVIYSYVKSLQKEGIFDAKVITWKIQE